MADDKEDAGRLHVPAAAHYNGMKMSIEKVIDAGQRTLGVLTALAKRDHDMQEQIDDLKRMTVALTTVCTSLKQRLDARDKLDRELDDALREPPAPPML